MAAIWPATKRRGGRRNWRGWRRNCCCRGGRCAAAAAQPAADLRRAWLSKSTGWPCLLPHCNGGCCDHAAEQFGVALDFAATEALRSLALAGRAGQRLALAAGLARRADRARAESFRWAGSCSEGRLERRFRSTARRFPAKSMRRPSVFASGSRFPTRQRPMEAGTGAGGHHRRDGHPAQLEARRPGEAALLRRAAQSEGSVGTSAGYGNRAGALAGAGGRRAHRLDAGRGTGAANRALRSRQLLPPAAVCNAPNELRHRSTVDVAGSTAFCGIWIVPAFLALGVQSGYCSSRRHARRVRRGELCTFCHFAKRANV